MGNTLIVSGAPISMLLERLPPPKKAQTQQHAALPPPKESKPFQGKTMEINYNIRQSGKGERTKFYACS